MRDVLTRPDGDVALARPTAADICGRATAYVRRDGSRGPIPKATLWKHFKTVQSLAAAVVEQSAAEQRPVPAPIADLARTTPARAETLDAARLEARLSSRHYDVAELECQFEVAQARGPDYEAGPTTGGRAGRRCGIYGGGEDQACMSRSCVDDPTGPL